MDNLKVKPISFNGAYKIKGSDEVIDEICWYLQKKKKSQDPAFDFLDIRMVKKSADETDRILKNVNPSEVKNKDKQSAITSHLLEIMAIKKGVIQPFQTTGPKENLDLFLTDNDKIKAENKIINMIEESLANVFRLNDFNNKAKILLENLSAMRNNLSNGKPILNINPEVAHKHLEQLNAPNLKIMEADEVLEGIKKGKFDIISGDLYK